MAKVRIKNIGDQLLVSLDNNTVSMHDKSNVGFSITDYIVSMVDGENLVFAELTKDFEEPKEASPVDLMLLLNSMLLNEGETSTKQVSDDISAVAYDFILMTTGNTDKTVLLPLNPTKDNVIEVSKRDVGTGDVIIDGNGFLINGSSTDTIPSQYTSSSYQFDSTEWVKRF